MHLIVYPNGGLANRMRTIDSAVNLCNQKYNLTVVWYKDWGLGCNWNELFEHCSFVQDRTIPRLMRYVLNHYEDNAFIKTMLWLLKKLHLLWFCDIKGAEFIPCIKEIQDGGYLYAVIRSWEAFFPSERFRKELFLIKDKQRLANELAKVDSHTIGVHIRRTDNVWSVEHSPIDLFEERMRMELKCDSEVNFYLCSDDESVKTHFRSGEWAKMVRMPDGIINRNSKEGVIQAACEMFALSATKKIIGSYWSSFGEVAAMLGNIEFEACNKFA